MLAATHTTLCSAAGNLKNAIMTIVGAFAFGDFVFEPWNAAGLAVSMAGAVWYAMRSALRVSTPRGCTKLWVGPGEKPVAGAGCLWRARLS